MREFCEVNSDIWTDEATKPIAHCATTGVLAFYLMTAAPSNTVPSFGLTMDAIAADTGLPRETIAVGFEVLKKIGFAEYDAAAEAVVVRGMASYFR